MRYTETWIIVFPGFEKTIYARWPCRFALNDGHLRMVPTSLDVETETGSYKYLRTTFTGTVVAFPTFKRTKHGSESIIG